MNWKKYGTGHSICIARYENHPDCELSRYKEEEYIKIRLYAGTGASLCKEGIGRIISSWRREKLINWSSAYIEDDVIDVEIIDSNKKIFYPKGSKIVIGHHQILRKMHPDDVMVDVL